MITARIMGTTPTKELAAARENAAQFERTIATELPQELSKLPEAGGFFDVSSCPKRAAAVPKTRKHAVITTTGFTDDGHPTILADPRGWIRRS
jgi:hypothetical protein